MPQARTSLSPEANLVVQLIGTGLGKLCGYFISPMIQRWLPLPNHMSQYAPNLISDTMGVFGWYLTIRLWQPAQVPVIAPQFDKQKRIHQLQREIELRQAELLKLQNNVPFNQTEVTCNP